MQRDEYLQLKKFFVIGIVFATLTMFGGEIPIGWTVYPDTKNELLRIIVGSGNLSLLQLACGVLFGGIGIPLQYYGYKAIGNIIKMGDCKRCGNLVHIGAKAIAFWGGIVHIICVALMFVCKLEKTHTIDTVPQSVIDFTMWLVLPISTIFMAIYIPMTVAMMIPVLKGKTIFPKWSIVFNPIFFKIIFNILAFTLPNKAIWNGIRMSNMGLGSLVTFIGLMTLVSRYYNGLDNCDA